MSTRTSAVLGIAAVLLGAMPVAAQNFPTDDAVIEAIWNEGIENSQAWTIGQAMLDSIGPRLTGTPAVDRANQWAQTVMSGWGVEARVENYGTWKGWERGVTHVDLLEPRVRTLEATLMAWSPGTDGTAEGGVVTFPDVEDAAGFDSWLPWWRGTSWLLPCHGIRAARWPATRSTEPRRRSKQCERSDAPCK